VLSSSGALWKEQRKTSLQIFHQLGMGRQQLGLRIQEEIDNFLHALTQRQGAPVVDIESLTFVSVCNVICSVVFGKRFQYGDPEILSYMECIKENVKLTGSELRFRWSCL
jgi:cytochrome P450 family 2 subfamily U polypeptide 1